MPLRPGHIARRRVQAALAYPADFAASAVANVLILAVGLIFLGALFTHIPTLGGWTAWEMLFCWGYAETSVSLLYVGFQGLFTLNVRYVLGGELDRVLVRPGDPLAQVLLENLGVHEVPVVGLGLAVMAWAATGLDPLPLWRWAWLPMSLLSSVAVLGGVLTAFSSLVFHVPHRGSAVGLVMQTTMFNRYPVDLFAAPLRILLTWVIPLSFAGFYGAVAFLGRPGWTAFAMVQPLVGAVALAVGWRLWRFGLRRYTSSGS